MEDIRREVTDWHAAEQQSERFVADGLVGELADNFLELAEPAFGEMAVIEQNPVALVLAALDHELCFFALPLTE